jgi:hypothetical protein
MRDVVKGARCMMFRTLLSLATPDIPDSEKGKAVASSLQSTHPGSALPENKPELTEGSETPPVSGQEQPFTSNFLSRRVALSVFKPEPEDHPRRR